MNSEDVAFLPASVMEERIRSQDLPAAEFIEIMIERIERLTVLRVARAFEEAAQWAVNRPPL
jgi:hypothetical protein